MENTKNCLKAGDYVGTSSLDIYKEYKHLLGTVENAEKCFGRHSKMIGTVQGKDLDIWFICHSNLTDTKDKDWKNVIEEEKIHEKYLSGEPEPDHKFQRVVFVKKADNQYYFWGVFKRDEKEREENLRRGSDAEPRTYYRESDRYPI